jgi:hypothetical protein
MQTLVKNELLENFVSIFEETCKQSSLTGLSEYGINEVQNYYTTFKDGVVKNVLDDIQNEFYLVFCKDFNVDSISDLDYCIEDYKDDGFDNFISKVEKNSINNGISFSIDDESTDIIEFGSELIYTIRFNLSEVI